MKAIRWLLKLVLVMITLPLILAVWLAKWFVVFLHSSRQSAHKNNFNRFKIYSSKNQR